MRKLKPMWIILGVIVLVIFILGSSLIGSYNGLVTANEDIDGKWGQIQTDLQRRADLIPNLVETVKGYASHENEILTEIAEARSRLIGARGAEQTANANNELSSALSRLLAISEAYPNLKADANFRQLMDELSGTENRIARKRQLYNDSVQSYNTRVKRFPTVLIANMLGFQQREYFEADKGSEIAPKVNF